MKPTGPMFNVLEVQPTASQHGARVVVQATASRFAGLATKSWAGKTLADSAINQRNRDPASRVD